MIGKEIAKDNKIMLNAEIYTLLSAYCLSNDLNVPEVKRRFPFASKEAKF